MTAGCADGRYVLRPRGRRRPGGRRDAGTFRAPGPHTTTNQAQCRYILRPGATHDREQTDEGTFRAGGPHLTAGCADGRYVSRPRATHDHESGGAGTSCGPGATHDREPDEPREGLAPAGHTRPRARRSAGTSCAPGPHTTASHANHGNVSRPRATPPGPPGSWKPPTNRTSPSPCSSRGHTGIVDSSCRPSSSTGSERSAARSQIPRSSAGQIQAVLLASSSRLHQR